MNPEPTNPDQQYSDELDRILKQYSTDVQQGRAEAGLGVAKAAIAAREQRLLDLIADWVIGEDEPLTEVFMGVTGYVRGYTNKAARNKRRQEQRQKLAAIRSKL